MKSYIMFAIIGLLGSLVICTSTQETIAAPVTCIALVFSFVLFLIDILDKDN